MTGMSYKDFKYQFDDYGATGSGGAFVGLSDGFILALFSIRTFTGCYYILKTIFPPKMDYQYLEQFGKLKWHTKRVKHMRINFKNYTLACNVSSFFILVQTIVLLLVTWTQTSLYFRYVFLIILTLFTLAMLPIINDHLKELDDQVTFRIDRYETVVKENNERKALI